jgi:thioredoxin-dependent peroxiredoxin
MLNIGDTAPAFTLKNDKGVDVSLKDFKGKNVILYFYPKDDTPGCTKEACDFRDNQKKFSGKNMVVLGVSADNVASHVKFKEKYDLPFLLLSDPDKKMINDYGVWIEKSMYGKKYMGIERATFVIDKNGAIKNIFHKVKVDGHIDEILENLN